MQKKKNKLCTRRRSRPYPRFRKKTSTDEECKLNIFLNPDSTGIERRSLIARRCPVEVTNFVQLLRWVKEKFNLDPDFVAKVMYRPFFAMWLAFYLATKGARLCYQAVWDSRQARHLMLATWVAALSFDSASKNRVQSKVERFLGTSNFISVKHHYIRLNISDASAYDRAKKMIHGILHKIAKEVGKPLAIFLQHKLTITRTKGPTLFDALPNHRILSRQTCFDRVKELDEATSEAVHKGVDITADGTNWDVPWLQSQQQITL